ncbi:hypothetical protein ACIQU4_09650 [Streptomyces sp. NPDC090741]|uniref:hypothetical protein n=1 Tax=Streptomyces sp. NPDC090741 TaxID=3365967 RepID=UPI0037F20B27
MATPRIPLTPLTASTATTAPTPPSRLTDRDERALVAAAENRISEPLRLGPALARVRRLLTRRPRTGPQGRESLTCQPTTRTHPRAR